MGACLSQGDDQELRAHRDAERQLKEARTL